HLGRHGDLGASREKRSLSGHAALLQRRHLGRLRGDRSTQEVVASGPTSLAVPTGIPSAGAEQEGDERLAVVTAASETERGETLTALSGERQVSASGQVSVSITLLKDLSVTLVAPSGVQQAVPLRLNAKRVQLLAYLAWKGREA